MAFEPFVAMLSCACEVCRCLREVYQVSCHVQFRCLVFLEAYKKHSRSIQTYIILYSLFCDVSKLRMARTNQEVYFTCIFHFKCAGWVGAPVYSWYRFSRGKGSVVLRLEPSRLELFNFGRPQFRSTTVSCAFGSSDFALVQVLFLWLLLW